MKKFLVVLVGLLGFYLHIFAQDNVKVMYYNILEYPLNPSTKAVYLKTIFDYYQPDVLVCDEVVSDAISIDILNNVINITSGNNYAKAAFTDGPDKDNMIFFNLNKLSLDYQSFIPTALRYINRYRLHYNSVAPDNIYLDFYAAHLKASQGFEQDRYLECVEFKNYIATNTTGQNIIFGGDFNFYTSTEPAYQLLLDPSNYTLYDPINSPGTWNANSTFAAIHTQSTHAATSGGFIGGGLDDRFDFILTSNDLLSQASNVHYIANSYKALGNDGLHFNKNLTDLPLSTTVPESVTNALFNMSDHLPVVMELYVNAISSVTDHLQFAGVSATGNTLVNLSPFTVEVRNSLNVLNTGFTGSITLSKLQGAGNLIGTLTVNAVGGIATFSDVRFDQSGTYKLACSASGLTSGNSDNIVITSLGPDNLQFVGVPASGNPSINLAPFTVEVHDIANQVYTGYSGSITLLKLAGTGNLLGTLTVNAVAGIATFSDVRFDQAGTYGLICSASGLIPASSNNIVITAAIPSLTELVVPKYMGSRTTASLNSARTAFAVCLRIDHLSPNTVYDLKAGIGLTSDAPSDYGAGNVWNAGSFQSTTTTISNAITTDISGSSQPFWLFIQPTANDRFEAGLIHNLRLGYEVSGTSFSGGPDFVGTKTITTLDIAPAARTTATTDDGAFIKGTADLSVGGKFVLLYDNESGTGDPLFSYMIRQATATQATNTGLPQAINDIYLQSGTSAISDYPAVIPIGANNPNGVRRIESRNSDNTIYGYNTDADGIWPSGANTTTISRRSVALINSTEAPLTPVILTKTLNLTVFLEGLYNGSGTMRKAQDISGDHFTGNTSDQITIELHNSSTYSTVVYTINNVNLSTSGIASVNIPLINNGSYYITVKHRNSIEITTSAAVSFSGSTIYYNFSDVATKVFDSNQKQMNDGKWVIYSGDVNQDGIIDAGDLTITDNDASSFTSGYLATDIDGNGQVDTDDISIIENNGTFFIAAKTP